jgi:glycerate kinase
MVRSARDDDSGPDIPEACPAENRAASSAVVSGDLAPCRVLVALDKFKGALDAEAACDVVRRVIERQRPSWHVDVAPLTDGGDGFCRILTAAAGGALHERVARGPLVERAGGSNVTAPIGVVELAALPPRARELLALDAGARRLAVVEMASVSGLALVPRERIDVWRSSSYGTGELLAAARALGVDAILLGVGGSATSDLGLGALDALGFEFTSSEGESLSPPVPELWPRLARVAGGPSAGLPPLRIACDVESPVFGPRGAAAVYGPQKGLRREDLERFEAEAQRVAGLLLQHLRIDAELAERPGAGAAGGIAFGLSAAMGARLVPGSALVAAWIGLEARLRAADWLVTGEGRYDESSAAGKGPGALVAAARAERRPAVVFAGAVTAEGPRVEGAPCELIAISDPALALDRALADTARNLARSVERWLERLPRQARPPETLPREPPETPPREH